MSAQVDIGRSELTSLKRHGWLGLLAVVGLFGGLIFWASVSNISGAIIAHGLMEVQDNAKRVQHPEGGVISQVLVRNEDYVEAGQLLAVLDQTTISAAVALSENQLREAYAREARLIAELAGEAKVGRPEAAMQIFTDEQMAPLLSLEQDILDARRQSREERISQLNEQIVQLDRQREGLNFQQQAMESQIGVVETEIADFDELYADRLIAASRGTSLDKELAMAQGQLGQLVATVAATQAAAAERAVQIEQIKSEFIAAALAELQEARSIISSASQRRIADRDRLARTEIRAPHSGVVHESVLHTVGGVIGSGETLMLIVPRDEPLVVSVRIDPIDIDKVAVGQEAVLRLPGLNPRTTPELFATVMRVAPDLTIDRMTGQHYFGARISIPKEQLERLPPEVTLVPGMPVEAYVQIGDRTVLSYLLHPATEQLRRAFREE